MKTPNILTLIRIVISPLFIFFFSLDTFWSLSICFLLLIVIEATDFLDGRIARKYGQISDFGKLMDPFADSISRFSVYLCFLSANLAPVWMIAIFFYRDVLVSVVRVFSMKAGVVVAARKSGKTKAWVQATSIFLVLLVLLLQKQSLLPEALVNLRPISLTAGVIFIASMITLWSAIDYWSANKSTVLSAMRHTEKRKERLSKAEKM